MAYKGLIKQLYILEYLTGLILALLTLFLFILCLDLKKIFGKSVKQS